MLRGVRLGSGRPAFPDRHHCTQDLKRRDQKKATLARPEFGTRGGTEGGLFQDFPSFDLKLFGKISLSSATHKVWTFLFANPLKKCG